MASEPFKLSLPRPTWDCTGLWFLRPVLTKGKFLRIQLTGPKSIRSSGIHSVEKKTEAEPSQAACPRESVKVPVRVSGFPLQTFLCYSINLTGPH